MSLIQDIAALLCERQATLATAESCTGGLVGHLLTNQPGSSAWYVGGLVAYSNALKGGMLGVRGETLDQVGAVSAPVAKQMALGARQAFDTDYAISITGIAGPNGGTDVKPVGLTYIGIATPEQVLVRRYRWLGSREANKLSSAQQALLMLAEVLAGSRLVTQEEAVPQPIKVEATFQGDLIRPLAFEWEGQMQKVVDRGRQWEAEGEQHFLVMTAGNRVWELCFHLSTLQWTVTPRTARHALA